MGFDVNVTANVAICDQSDTDLKRKLFKCG